MDQQKSTPRDAGVHIAIIGGGVAGLSAAFDLTAWDANGSTPVRVDVFESGEKLGGLAAGFRGRPEWEWPLERFYHHLFTNDDAIIGLTDEIGLADKLRIHAPITAMFSQGELHRLDSPTSVLQFPLIPFADRVRMGAALAYLRYDPRKPWQAYDKVLADEWLAKWMGRTAYEAIWRPMLQGKFGPRYDQVNLAWFWARIVKRTPKLGYYEGGFQAFVDGLARAVLERSAHVFTQRPITRIERRANGYALHGADGSVEEYDAVLGTVSPGLMAKLTPDLPSGYLSGLTGLQSMGAVVLTVALDRQLLREVYWANIPKREGLPFLALVEHTNMIDPARYGGNHLLYIGDYVEPDHRYFDLSADELLAEVVPHLQKFNADFRPEWVTGAWVHKAKYAQPVPGVGYADQIPSIRTPLPGLYFASMSQVYPWDRGTNYAVEMGRSVAAMIQKDLRTGVVAGGSRRAIQT